MPGKIFLPDGNKHVKCPFETDLKYKINVSHFHYCFSMFAFVTFSITFSPKLISETCAFPLGRKCEKNCHFS